MARSEIARIGPFAQGLNNVLDPTSIGDGQLVDVVNFEVTEDGTLTNRPVITVNQWGYDYGTGGNGLIANQTGGSAVLPIAVGRYRNDGAAVLYKDINGEIFWERMNSAATSLGIGNKKVVGVGGPTGSNVGFTMCQYLGRMYVTNARNPDYTGYTTIGDTNWVPIPSMPMGETMFEHKGRLFIFPSQYTDSAENDHNSKFFYSDAPYDGGAWDPDKNFVHVGYGDGQYVTAALVYNGDILIFKENSTWRFSYEANIGTGMLERIHPDVGSMKHSTVTVCNGHVYTFCDGAVYEIFNYQWRKISGDIKFDREILSGSESFVDGVNLGKLGDRVILNHYGKTYVYSQRSQAWTQWETESKPGRVVTINSTILDNYDKDMALCSYYKHTRRPGNDSDNWRITRLYRIFDHNNAVTDIINQGGAGPEAVQNSESFECRIRTKSYDLGGDSAFKRLMWWGASVFTNTDVQGRAVVIVNNAGFTYDELDGTLYDLLEQATHDHLLDILPEAVTDRDTENYASHGRRFVKFLKGLRFRQIYFEYKTVVDGTSSTLPTKLFSLTAVFRGKTKMSKGIS